MKKISDANKPSKRKGRCTCSPFSMLRFTIRRKWDSEGRRLAGNLVFQPNPAAGTTHKSQTPFPL